MKGIVKTFKPNELNIGNVSKNGNTDISDVKILLINSAPWNQSIQNDPIFPRCPGMVKKVGDKILPIGLLKIASELAHKGATVSFIDRSTIEHQRKNIKLFLKTIIKDFNLIIINSSHVTYKEDIFFANWIKKHNQNGFVTAIGYYPTIFPELYTKTGFDRVISGEPDEAIIEIVKDINDTDIQNENKSIRRRQDLDSIYPPLLDLINLKDYSLPYGISPVYTFLTTTRGCLHKCSFCTSPIYSKNGIHKRPIQNVIRELLEIRKKYGITEFHIFDDSFFSDRKYLTEFLTALEELKENNIRFHWSCAVRIDEIVDLSLLMKARNVGCYLLKMGIETFNKKAQKSSKKRIKKDIINKNLKIIHKARFEILTYFMLGFPEDSISSILNTIINSFRIKSTMNLFNFTIPWVGTELFSLYRKKYAKKINYLRDLNSEQFIEFYSKSFNGSKPVPFLSNISRRLQKLLLLLGFSLNLINPRFIRFFIYRAIYVRFYKMHKQSSSRYEMVGNYLIKTVREGIRTFAGVFLK